MDQKKQIIVITGGGSGMGLATAKYLDKSKTIVVTGRTVKKLENAVNELTALGYEAYPKACDVSDKKSVHELFCYAAMLGDVKTVIHAAGLSPNMADGKTLLKVNALGTVYVNTEAKKVMENGGVIVDVSSNAAYELPDVVTKLTKKIYPLAETDETAFLKKLHKLALLPKDAYQKAGFAYAISKNFVVWYAQKCAFTFGKDGIRVVSLSPGLIATDMGKREEKEGGALIPFTAEERMGKPEELGFAIATVADERNGYLAGVDVLVDGGSTNGKLFK